MSGFYLLVLLAVWLLIGWFCYHIWRVKRPTSLAPKILHIILGVALFSIWIGGAFWEIAGKRAYWDSKVRELCAKDGGIKVYETIVLQDDQFDKWGRVLLYQPTGGEDALGRNYLFESNTEFVRNEDPQIQRFQYQVYRRNDDKLLGTSVCYYRMGGDLPGPWHPSSFGCPSNAGDASLVKKIFIMNEKESEINGND